MACFEPTIDYVVTKIPRFAFEKFPEADSTLTTQMKSVGETMAIGRTFKESFQKALRGLEVGSFGFGCDSKDLWGTPNQPTLEEIRATIATPGDERVWYLRYAFKAGMTRDEIYQLTHIDPWFLSNLQELVELEEELRRQPGLTGVSTALLREAKRNGFSDRQLASIWNVPEMNVRAERQRRGIVVTFKSVDTCAAEFEAYTPVLLFHLRGRRRNPRQGAGTAADHDSRRRAEPDRAGDRIRLLLLPCQLRPARAGHPVDHGQFESRDREHRLRHQRPACSSSR